MPIDPNELTIEQLVNILKRKGVTVSELLRQFEGAEEKYRRVKTLRVDSWRGVIYVHNEHEKLLLRLSGLPTPIPTLLEMHYRPYSADLENGTNWPGVEGWAERESNEIAVTYPELAVGGATTKETLEWLRTHEKFEKWQNVRGNLYDGLQAVNYHFIFPTPFNDGYSLLVHGRDERPFNLWSLREFLEGVPLPRYWANTDGEVFDKDDEKIDFVVERCFLCREGAEPERQE